MKQIRNGRLVEGVEHGDYGIRIARAVALLYAGHTITTRFLMEKLGVSKPTARRYMTILEVALPVDLKGGGRGIRNEMRLLET